MAGGTDDYSSVIWEMGCLAEAWPLRKAFLVLNLDSENPVKILRRGSESVCVCVYKSEFSLMTLIMLMLPSGYCDWTFSWTLIFNNEPQF